MKIQKIKKLQNGKYKIMIDEETIVTFDDVILKNNLLYKKEIDSELYNSILVDTDYYSAYNKAIKYILKKRRSEKEINEYLLKLNINTEDIKSIIVKLKNNNLINDTEYCKAYINDSINLGKKGINRIKNELTIQNIPLNIIEEELKNIDIKVVNDKLEKIIIKKIKLNKKNSNSILKQKILNDMIELGYERDRILEILDKNLCDDNYILKKEFDKLYIKLSKKYAGNELIKNIKNKMLIKGFNINEINKLILEKTEK